ncbi:GNAT family N-acetyltransferase [Pseudarthrobacter sulfonivorans]|uniref:GNAT family N-acetyltransferase n=1 Tax=Pseudarthrobacter sulfonivorans TaxID=121292 RepID=UPI00278AFD8D|nr:GNAT family N-acetyltransferase [Pseudarthrobacter sulfonivorans]MDP9998387.1 GNAT superfamily N-acetyltransferase [Pseudarthrobacter sulfonivorans]
MASLISLAALIEPQILDPFVTAPRVIHAPDLPELTDLYLHAYADGTFNPDAETAAAGINAIFDGARGALIPQASLLTRDTDGRITAAIITTERTFRSDRPKTPFIAQLFTHPEYRRQHLAETLLSHAMQALHDSGHKTLAVTVSSSNAAAIALYLARDFRRFTPAVTSDND